MQTSAATFEQELDDVADMLRRILNRSDIAGLADDPLLSTVRATEAVGRHLDALRALLAGEVAQRSRSELRADGLAAKKGCGSANELLRRLTLASGESVHRRILVGSETRSRFSLQGEELPAAFPRVASALESGELGVDSAHTIIRGLSSVRDRVSSDGIRAAELELTAAATGSGPDSALPASADEIRIQTELWKLHLDQDGTLRNEERAMRMRGVRLGRERDGLIPIYGGLMPDVAGKLLAVFNACLSPRTAPAFLREEELAAARLEADPRTRDQQRHDVLAGIIDIASRSADVPTMGGAAPTVMVTVRASDLNSGKGVGFIDGIDTAISLTAINQLACAGGTQRIVITEQGCIMELGSPERLFTNRQRRAITARDGGCAIPGCHVPASWCEIHHVIPAVEGGETHVHNGVLLCWFHHRTIETSGWLIRIIEGVVQVKAPRWLDPTGEWRPANSSRVRQLNQLDPQLE
ncbi:HNH endonuclease signature motif containing protein [Cryobacterium sp. BB736]|uniref:HNH endonuclease signature motif containing protein n=1 Tax=Cryobacterium sp. BB736 TaxID=2746963 RepID=UPI001873CD42|nr:HNH endonuclease signature motif containing protein [Cryobacterium sp. BB736]